MKPLKITAVFFSPTGATKDLTLRLASQLAEYYGVSFGAVDITLPAAREKEYSFSAGDMVVFGMPTYAGKLPNKILPFVKDGFKGEGALAAALVTFGNRSFDNSLAELAACLKANGFGLLGGGAFAARHCFSKILAAGRPDDEDYAQLKAYGEAIAAKLDSAETSDGAGFKEPAIPGDADAPYYRPKGVDGQPAVFLKAKPKTNPVLCDSCMICAEVCPVGSIDPKDPFAVNGICIKCHACIRRCPKGAKYFDDPAFLSHKEMLEKTFMERSEPAWFV